MPNENSKLDFYFAFAGTAGLFFISFLIPFLGIFSLIFVPTPLLLYRARHSANKGLLLFISLFLFIVVTLYFFNYSGEVITFLLLAMLGIFLGEAMERGFSITRTALGCVILMVVPLCGAWLLIALQLGKTPNFVLHQIVLANIEEALRLYEAQGLFLEAAGALKKNAREVATLISNIFPALLVILSLLVGMANMIVGAIFLRRKGFPAWTADDFYSWKAPEGLVWVLIGAAGTALFFTYKYIPTVGSNISLICLAIYALQGLAIMFCLFQTWRVPIFIRLIFLLLLLLQQYLLVPIIFLGLFDLWFDFRKRIKSQK